MKHSKYTEECLSVIAPYLTGTANTCSYCDHLDILILQEGLYTYITIAIGQIIEGYLQVCSQKHRTAATGLYAHEAEVSYLRNMGFKEKDIMFINEVRYFRNSVTYYGKILGVDYAEKVARFTKEMYPKLKEKCVK